MTILEKRQHLHMLLAKNHMIAAKEHVLSIYNAERIRDLSEADLDDCIDRLSRIADAKNNDSEIRHWRHVCLRAMSKFVNTQDWNNVNKFMLNKKVAGKHLYELSVDELKVLHRKINQIAGVIERRDKQLRWQAANN